MRQSETKIERQALVCAVSLCLACIAGLIVDINNLLATKMYNQDLFRAFLGASRPRTDEQRLGSLISHKVRFAFRIQLRSYLLMTTSKLAVFRFAEALQGVDARSYTGPLPLINHCGQLLQGCSFGIQERKAVSFLLSP